jgi:hypothetical protein
MASGFSVGPECLSTGTHPCVDPSPHLLSSSYWCWLVNSLNRTVISVCEVLSFINWSWIGPSFHDSERGALRRGVWGGSGLACPSRGPDLHFGAVIWLVSFKHSKGLILMVWGGTINRFILHAPQAHGACFSGCMKDMPLIDATEIGWRDIMPLITRCIFGKSRNKSLFFKKKKN